jgi:hypothetical protein
LREWCGMGRRVPLEHPASGRRLFDGDGGERGESNPAGYRDRYGTPVQQAPIKSPRNA